MTPETIIIEVCAQSNITQAELLSHRRDKQFVQARKQCARLLRGMGITYHAIAAHMNRDHSSIVHYIKPTPSHWPKRGFVEMEGGKS